MDSPATTWSGPIELGLLNIPVTLGKAAEANRESDLVQVCIGDGDGHDPIRIDRSERCHACIGKPRKKRKAVETEKGVFRVFDEHEIIEIENETQLKTLKIIDVQPANRLPLMYSTGAYYIRHDDKSKVAPTTLATLVAAMMKSKLCLVCKLGNSSAQKLCVISAESGLLILRQIPFLADIRKASDRERAHMKVKVEPRAVKKMSELLAELQNPHGFQYKEYNDDGYTLRKQAVERVLNGEKKQQKKKKQQEYNQHVDIFDEIDRAMNSLQKEKQNV